MEAQRNQARHCQTRELWDGHAVTLNVMGEQFESVFYKAALKATGQWLLSEVCHSPCSLVKAHRGSQLAGQTPPREGGGRT